MPADDAGAYRVVVTGQTWPDRLLAVSWLTDTQHETALRLATLFDASGTRPRIVSRYEGSRVNTSGPPEHALETQTASELAAWRKLQRLLAACTPSDRTCVEATCFWDMPPANLARLQRGLGAVAAALRGRR